VNRKDPERLRALTINSVQSKQSQYEVKEDDWIGRKTLHHRRRCLGPGKTGKVAGGRPKSVRTKKN
jgi:hypothetical protein